ncbi:MAG: hypothetical protein K0V04_19025 [Deltaproteobacteria bacterium]|nr:hypothetical protein [Deltaproteobacteria bacterium]
MSPILASYGPRGTCWDAFEPSVCFQDCRAGLIALGLANDEVSACRECEREDECAYLETESSCSLEGDCLVPVEGEGDVGDPCYDVSDCMGACYHADECPESSYSTTLSCRFASFSDEVGVCVDACENSDEQCFVDGWFCDYDEELCVSQDPYQCDDAENCEECLAAGCIFSGWTVDREFMQIDDCSQHVDFPPVFLCELEE